MKILFLSDALGKGGSERRMLELIKHLSYNTGHEVSYFCLTDHIQYDSVYQLPINFKVVKRVFKKDPTVFFRLFKMIRQLKPDIIHSWSSMSNIYTLPIAKILNIKFISSAIADSPKNLSYKNKAYLRAQLIFPFADCITSNSIAGLRAYDAPAKKSICIYNGFDKKRTASLADEKLLKQELGSEGKLVVGMVAAFEHRKDHATFIQSAKMVIEQFPGVVFLLIGDGPLRFEMMKTAEGKQQDSIRFLGKIDNVESYINLFDIGVLCTNTKVHQEGISNSILEYMALRKPVVATEGGGTNEIVVDNETGFLVPAHHVNVLTEKILLLLKDEELRKAFGVKGLERVETHFTIDSMCMQFKNLYKYLVENKNEIDNPFLRKIPSV